MYRYGQGSFANFKEGEPIMNRMLFIPVLSLLCPSQAGMVLAASASQVDDFQDGTTQGWTSGSQNPVPPIREADGGPAGNGDGYLKIRSLGGAGAGSKLVAFNRLQWTGDYIATGATALAAQVNNLGTTNLKLRVAFQGVGGTFFVSRDPVPLNPGSGWREAVFPIQETDLTRTDGSGTYGAVLGNVQELRINSSNVPNNLGKGDSIQATLGVDNIRLLGSAGTPFRRGDVTDSGDVDISDIIALLDVLFLGGDPLPCSDAGDSNDDGAIDLGDPIFTLFSIFLMDQNIPDPGPTDCGPDPTGDELPCESQSSCS